MRLMNALTGQRSNRFQSNQGMNTVTAMVVGAGIGIAAYEMMRRNNVAGNSTEMISNMAENVMNNLD